MHQQGCRSPNPLPHIEDLVNLLTPTIYESNELVATIEADMDGMGACGLDFDEFLTLVKDTTGYLEVLEGLGSEALQLLSCERVNSIFTTVMHDGLCDALPTAFVWIFMSGVCTSICALVLFTCRAACLPAIELTEGESIEAKALSDTEENKKKDASHDTDSASSTGGDVENMMSNEKPTGELEGDVVILESASTQISDPTQTISKTLSHNEKKLETIQDTDSASSTDTEEEVLMRHESKDEEAIVKNDSTIPAMDSTMEKSTDETESSFAMQLNESTDADVPDGKDIPVTTSHDTIHQESNLGTRSQDESIQITAQSTEEVTGSVDDTSVLQKIEVERKQSTDGSIVEEKNSHDETTQIAMEATEESTGDANDTGDAKKR